MADFWRIFGCPSGTEVVLFKDVFGGLWPFLADFWRILGGFLADFWRIMPIDLFVQIDLFVDSMGGGWLDAATEAACAMVDLDNFFTTGAKATSTGLFFSLFLSLGLSLL